MSDYSEAGTQAVEDAAVDDPPTVDEVREAQAREHPRQAATRHEGSPARPPEDGTSDGGEP